MSEPEAVTDLQLIAKALNRLADAEFRSAKASERAVQLQEQMVAFQVSQMGATAELEKMLRGKLKTDG